eukprot:Gb_19573 [translate_table: standard]
MGVIHISFSLFVQDSWNGLEQQDFMIGVGAMQKALIKRANEMQEDSLNVQQEIQAFEGKGYELGTKTTAAISTKQNDRVVDKRKDKKKESVVAKESTKKPGKSDGVPDPEILLQNSQISADHQNSKISG